MNSSRIKKLPIVLMLFVVTLLAFMGASIAANSEIAKAVKSATWPVRATDNDITIQVNKPGIFPQGENNVQLFIVTDHNTTAAGTVIGPDQFLAASFYAWTDPQYDKDGNPTIIQFGEMSIDASALQSRWNLPNGATAMIYFEYEDGTTGNVVGTFWNGNLVFSLPRDTMWTRCSIVMDKQYEPKPIPPGPSPTPTPDVGPTSPQTGLYATGEVK